MRAQRRNTTRKAEAKIDNEQKTKKSKKQPVKPLIDEIDMESSPDLLVGEESSPEKRKSFGDLVGRRNEHQISENETIEQIRLYCDPEKWSQEHGRVELRKRLKDICNVLARIDSLKNLKEFGMSSQTEICDGQYEICSVLSNLANVICESGILFERKSDDLQIFGACVLVEMLRLMDNPFTLSEGNESVKSKAEVKRRRRSSANEQNCVLSKVLSFLIEQISIGIADSGNPLFPMYFHVLEVLSNRSSFLLIARVQNERLQDTLYTTLFEAFLCVCEKSVLPQIRDFFFNILKDIILEPHVQMSGKIIVFIMNRLIVSQSNQSESKKMLVRLLSDCETKLSNDIIDILTSLSDFEGENADSFGPEKYCQLMYEISNILPSVFIVMLPTLHDFLCIDSVLHRSYFSRMFGKVLSSKDSKVPTATILTPFLKRFIDVDGQIRLECVQFSKSIVDVHSEFLPEVLEQLLTRILDQDEKVRKAACIAFYDIAKDYPDSIHDEEIEIYAGRMLDKSQSVRKCCIENISDLYGIWKMKASEEKSNVVLSSIIRLFSIPLARNEAEHVLDKKILSEGKQRTMEFLRMFSFASSNQKRDIIAFLITQRMKHCLSFSSFLEDEKSIGTDGLQSMLSKIIGQNISAVDSSALKKFMFSKDNITFWFKTLVSFDEDLQKKRSSCKEIEKCIKGLPCEKVMKLLLPKIGMYVISPQNIPELLNIVEFESENLEASDSLNALNLVLNIATEYPESISECQEILIDLILSANLEQNNFLEANQELLAIALQCLNFSVRVNPIKINQKLIDQFKNFIIHGNSFHVGIIAEIMANSGKQGTQIISKLLSNFAENLILADKQLVNKFAFIAKISFVQFETYDVISDRVLSFATDKLFQSIGNDLKFQSIATDEDFDFRTICPDSAFASTFELSKVIFCLASVLEIVTNTVIHELQTKSAESALLTFSEFKSLFVQIFSLNVVHDEQDQITVSDSVYLIARAVQCMVRVLKQSELESSLDADFVELIERLATSHCRYIRETVLECFWEVLSKMQIPFRYASVLVLSLIDPNPSFQKKSKTYLTAIINRKRIYLLRQQKGALSEKENKYVYSPEYLIAFVIRVIGCHPSFNGDLESCYHFLPCIERLMECFCVQDKSCDFALLMGIIGAVRKYTYPDPEDQEKTRRIYIVSEMVQRVIQHQSKGKEWKGESFSHQILLPTRFFKYNGGKVDTKQYLPNDFSLDKRSRQKNTETKPASRKRKPVESDSSSEDESSDEDY